MYMITVYPQYGVKNIQQIVQINLESKFSIIIYNRHLIMRQDNR